MEYRLTRIDRQVLRSIKCRLESIIEKLNEDAYYDDGTDEYGEDSPLLLDLKTMITDISSLIYHIESSENLDEDE